MLRVLASFYLIPTYLAFIFLFTSGCHQNKIIDEEKFIEIYTDIIIARDTTSVKEISASNDSIIKNVLVKHNVTLQEYQATVDYYNQESERWEKFFSKAIKYLDEKRKNVSK
jgi:hypothetical protein